MRIGFVADDLYPGLGGQAVATEGHIRVLRQRGHEIRVVAGAVPHPREPPKEVELLRVSSWRLEHKQVYVGLPAPRPLQWLLGWAEVLQVNLPSPLGLLSCLLARVRGIPSVMGVHVQIESGMSIFDRLRPIVKIGLAGWYRFVFRQPDALVAPSAFAAKMIEAFTPLPVKVVSNGVRLPAEVPAKLAWNRLPDAWRPPEGAKLLVYLGRLSPEKRPGDLLDLAARLSGGFLIIAGRGPLEATIQCEVERRGLEDRVRLVGFVTEERKQDLLAAADLFLMPSPTELQSIATLEALAHGCAVAVANHATSAVPEVVGEIGGGILYPPHAPDIAAAMIQAILDDGQRLAELQRCARAGVVRHDIRESGRILEEFYRALIES